LISPYEKVVCQERDCSKMIAVDKKREYDCRQRNVAILKKLT